MRIVLDTNVLVAGLLNPHGPPGRIVDLLLTGELSIAYDDRVLAEYREVLSRPRFGFDPHDIEHIVDLLEVEGGPAPAAPLDLPDLPDPDDLPFLEIAAAVEPYLLVTGNMRHFPPEARPEGVRVESPREFVTKWRGRSG